MGGYVELQIKFYHIHISSNLTVKQNKRGLCTPKLLNIDFDITDETDTGIISSDFQEDTHSVADSGRGSLTSSTRSTTLRPGGLFLRTFTEDADSGFLSFDVPEDPSALKRTSRHIFTYEFLYIYSVVQCVGYS